MSDTLDAVVMGYASVDSAITLRNLPAPGTTAIVEDGLDDEPAWGGCGPNIAVGLRRLGLRTGLISALGDDALSLRYLRWLREQDVETSAVAVATGGQAPRALMLSARDGTSWCLFRPGAGADLGDEGAQERLLRRTRRLVLTVGPAALTEQLLRQARDLDLSLAWGVKADPQAYPAELLRALVPACEVIVLNRAELAFLGERIGIANVADLLRLGPRVVALTAGAEGVQIWHAGGVVRQPALPVARIVDTTGSGDALTSGFLAAYWRAGDLARAARWGVANAAAVLAWRGSQTALCTAGELDRMVGGER